MSFRERKGDHNVKKSFTLAFLLILSVGLASAGLFGFLGDLNPFDAAEPVGADLNIKQYDDVSRTVTVKDIASPTDTIATVRLLSPHQNFVLPGKDRLVAEFEINSSRSYTDALKQIEFYNLKGNTSTSKTFTYKIRTQIGTYTVPEYDSCNIIRPIGQNESQQVAYRTFSKESYSPGSPMLITLNIVFDRTDCGAAIEEHVPEGWKVSDIKGEGDGFLGPDGAIRWAPISTPFCGGENLEYTLSYIATPDLDQVDPAVFKGAFSVDGNDHNIQGGKILTQIVGEKGTGNQPVGVEDQSSCNTQNITIPSYTWTNVADTKPDVTASSYHIGIFADVQPGETIEWIPTFFDVRIPEWALFTGYNTTQNKLFFFKFNQTSGTTVIDSMNHQNGTYNDTPVWEPSNWTGFGYAARHPGTARILNANISFNSSLEKNFTIEMRLTPTGVTSAGFLRIGTVSDTGFGYSFDGGTMLSQQIGSCGQVNAIGPTHPTFKKVTLVITRLDNVWKTYEDGVLVHTRTCDTSTFVNQSLYFGLDVAGTFGGFYNGQVDQMILWDRALTETEILIENASTSEDAVGSISTTITRLVSPTNGTLTNLNTYGFTASIEPGLNLNLTNATINVWYLNGSILTSIKNNVTGSNLNLSNWTVSGFSTGNSYLWNVLGCSENSSVASCEWAANNYTLIIGNLPDPGFINATAVSCSLQPSESACGEAPFPIYNIADANYATLYTYDTFDIAGQDSAITVANYTIPIELRTGTINVSTNFQGSSIFSTINISLACFNRTNNNRIMISASNIFVSDYNVNISGSIPTECLDSSYNLSLLTITVAPFVSLDTVSIVDSIFSNFSAPVADTTPPNIFITYPTNITYNANVTFLNYTVGSDASSCWYTTTNGVSNISLTCGNNVTGINSTQGSNTWRVYANDSSNNVNVSSVTFNIDSIPPNIAIRYPTNISYNKIISFLNYTVDSTATSCWYSTNLGVLNTTVTCGNNVTGLNSGQGSSTWKVWANDSVNNLNVSSVTFFVDSIAPTISILYPQNTTYNVTVTDINYTVGGSPQACWYTLDGGVNNISITCGNNVTGLSSGAGSKTWSVYANDSLNNLNVSSVTFFVNITSGTPAISITYPQNISYGTNVTALNYTVDSTATSCWYTLNLGILNTTIVCGNNVTGINSTQGSNTWRVYANSSSNNINFSSVTFNVNLTSNPIISSVMPISGSAFTIWNIRFNVSASAPLGISGYTYSINNGANVSFDGEENYTLPKGSYTTLFCVNDTTNKKTCTTTSYSLVDAAPTTQSETGGSATPPPTEDITTVVGQSSINLSSIKVVTDQKWVSNSRYYVTVETYDKNNNRIDVDHVRIDMQEGIKHVESKLTHLDDGTYQKSFIISNVSDESFIINISATQSQKTISRTVKIDLNTLEETSNLLTVPQNVLSQSAHQAYLFGREYWVFFVGLAVVGLVSASLILTSRR